MEQQEQLKTVQEMKMQVSVSATELKALHDCSRSLIYNSLSLNYEGYESSLFKKKAVRYMAGLLSEGCADFKEKTESFFKKGYQKAWFSSDAEYMSQYRRDLKKVLRIGGYIVKEEYTVKAVEYPYESEFKKPLEYRGYDIVSFKGKYDFILEKDGAEIGVILKNGTPQYSLKARKFEKRSDNSIELMTAYLGLALTHSNFQAELWYLTNKDDTGAEIMDLFEHREGKNIVRFCFDGMSITDVYNKLMNMLQSDECHDCNRCIHKNICYANRKTVRNDAKVIRSDTKADVTEPVYTEAQNRVIKHINGPMCVVAVPGAGKTKSLIERMVYLIKAGVKPHNILFVTFTKKAANEIETRVEKELVKCGITARPNIATYNSLGFSILKENPLYLGGRRIKLATDVDRYNLIYKAIISSPVINGVSYAGIHSDFGLVKTLDKFFYEIQENDEKMPGSGEEMFRRVYASRKDVDGILTVYHAYKEMYKQAGFISYDDQIEMVNDLFEKYPVLKKKYAEMYEYIMVDEFQDTCLEQAEMIYAIAKQHNNIVVVGDDDQSIYKWRGGSSSFMLNFRDDFPDAEIVNMSDNFRSSEEILNVANRLITGNGMRFEKKMISNKKTDGIKPVFIKGEHQYLATVVKTLLSKGCEPGDICILARNNKRLEEVQNILDGIVPVNLPKDYLVEDAVFLAIYDVLTLFYKGLNNDEALYRFFSYFNKSSLINKRDRHSSIYENLLAENKLMPVSFNEQCYKAYESKRNSSDFIQVGYILTQCFGKIQNFDIRTALEYIVESLFGLESHQVIEKLCEMADERGIVKMSHLYSVMSDMILYDVKERVGYDVSENAVNLLTSHDSKGKEFNTVIIYSIEDYENTEEEVRVLYVSMTRARKNLYMLETALPKDTSIFEKIRKDVKTMGC